MPSLERKNRVSQPEDGRKTRGIQNEHNVGLRRTRASICTQDRAESIKFKDQFVCRGLTRLQLSQFNHDFLLLSTLFTNY